MWREIVSSVLLLGLWSALTQAQVVTEECKARKPLVNLAGQGADITIGATPIQILGRNDARCQAMIRNKGPASMRCLPIDQGTPSASVGQEFAAGDYLILGPSSRPGWRCIRTTDTDTTATTIEEIP
jgi:hypothetical protein